MTKNTEDAAEPEAPATEAEPEAAAPYEAKIIEPVEPVEEQPAPPETPPEVPEGFTAVRYVGPADLFVHGAYSFRDGQPVNVPSEVAEELLTFPFERFERL